jgi:type I restriction enzyme S subunit
MSGVRTVLLKDICNLEKGSTGLMKAEPGEYPLVTTGKERRSCESYQFDTKAVCIPLVSSTGHGHASLNNVHYQEGKFALGTILVAITAKNEEELDVHFLHLYLSQLKDIVLVPLMKGAANVSLSITAIKSVKIPLPSITRQKEIVNKFKKVVQEEKQLIAELVIQKKLIDEIRLKTFQEAIEGKLTKVWREKQKDNTSAAKFLAQIQSEKETLISDKKIKKTQTLFPIDPKDTPFDIPSNWERCRLGSLYEVTRGSSPRPKGDPMYWVNERTDYHWITIADFTPYGLKGVLNNSKGFLTELGSKKSRHVSKGDLLIACSGVGSVGRCIRSGIEGYIYDGLLAIRNISNYSMREYLYYFLKYKESQIYSVASGANWLNINIELLSNYIVPIPPEHEVKEIVKKLGSIAEILEQLEKQIFENQMHANKLMSSILKEEFLPKGFTKK